MKNRFYILFAMLLFVGTSAYGEDLASWNDGKVKQRILEFVKQVDDAKVPMGERVAVFDNDGTLWTEQPIYIQGQFAFDRVKALAPQHPEWTTTQPYKAILENDAQTIKTFTELDLMTIIAATHAGMTTEEFNETVKQWIATAKHPRFNRLYKDCVYQPMLEVLTLLRAHGFKTYIVSGGGIDFMRAFAEGVYGVPPEQVIGSSGLTQFQIVNGRAELLKLPKVGSIDDKDGKPININLHIGRRPIFAFGNSDGDLQMLQYTDTGTPASLMLLVHHDDAAREYAYDLTSSIGKLDVAWDVAIQRGWEVVSMKNDFKTIFPAQPTKVK